MVDAVALGSLGEAATLKSFLRAGVPCYLPFGVYNADLVADFDGKLQRIQVKSAMGETVRFRPCRRCRDGWHSYPPGSVDWFAVYAADADKVYLIPADRASIRLHPGQPGTEQYSIDHVLGGLQDKNQR